MDCPEENDFETDELKHIWGVLSSDNLTGEEANLYTMNDLDITYLKDEDKYVLGVETIYMFDDENSKYRYMKFLLDKFTEFMEQNGYNTSKELSLHEVFSEGININTRFHSIEDCYTAFKMLVNGFCSLEKGDI